MQSAYLEQLKENQFEHAIVDRIMGTELAARDEKAFNDIMQPMCDALRQQVEAFKNAPPHEQNKMIAAFVVENLTTGLILKGVKLTVAKAARTATRATAALAEASRPAAIAKTAEGLGLRVADDAMVLEMEAEKAASTSMMENQAQKAGAKVEQAVIKNSEQVVTKYERYIQTMRLKIPKLEKYMAEKLAKIKDPVFTKAKLKHIFGVDKLVKERVSGKFDAKYSGYHHDKGWKLVKTGKVKFLSEPQVCPKTGMVYM